MIDAGRVVAVGKDGATMLAPRRAGARPIVLVLIGAFWPGHDATGPNQSFRALATALGHELEFKVVARDRPFGASAALVSSGQWFDRGFASFRYCMISRTGWPRGLGALLRETPHDLVMMNGFFDREFTLPTLLLRRLARVPRVPVILSTRGELAGGALGLKSGRKGLYLNLVRRLSLIDDVWLHATGDREAEDIRASVAFARGVVVAPNVRILGPLPVCSGGDTTAGSPLRLAFLGRVARVKNLDYALHVLGQVSVPVEFDIFGPVPDAAYEQECRAIIARLPEHAKVAWKGAIANEAVADTLAAYDLLLLPTRGENFGHAIVDALAAGTPVLISDQTPFQDLEGLGAGWSLPLADASAFARAIEELARMTPTVRNRQRQVARRLAERAVGESNAVAANRCMFENALAGLVQNGAEVSPPA